MCPRGECVPSAVLKATRLQYHQSAFSQVVPCGNINISRPRFV